MDNFSAELPAIREAGKQVEGFVTERESDFLALLAAFPTAKGSIVEIGNLFGRSTIVLAKAAQLSTEQHFASVDLPQPEQRAKLDANLLQAGVADLVELHSMTSRQFSNNWKGPIRLLWTDGPTDYDDVRHDIVTLIPHLSDGAIIAMDDVLNTSGQRCLVFRRDVLASPNIGRVGFCGAIGWAQYFKEPQRNFAYEKMKRKLMRLLKPLEPYCGSRPQGLARLKYKLLRSRIPHGQIDPQDWRLSKAA